MPTHRLGSPFATGFGLFAGWSCASLLLLCLILGGLVSCCGGAGFVLISAIMSVPDVKTTAPAGQSGASSSTKRATGRSSPAMPRRAAGVDDE